MMIKILCFFILLTFPLNAHAQNALLPTDVRAFMEEWRTMLRQARLTDAYLEEHGKNLTLNFSVTVKDKGAESMEEKRSKLSYNTLKNKEKIALFFQGNMVFDDMFIASDRRSAGGYIDINSAAKGDKNKTSIIVLNAHTRCAYQIILTGGRAPKPLLTKFDCNTYQTPLIFERGG